MSTMRALVTRTATRPLEIPPRSVRDIGDCDTAFCSNCHGSGFNQHCEICTECRGTGREPL